MEFSIRNSIKFSREMNSKLFFACISVLTILLDSCSNETKQESQNPLPVIQKDTIIKKKIITDSLIEPLVVINDTLNDMAGIIAGNKDSSSIFSAVTNHTDYKKFKIQFSRRWTNFDSSRIVQLATFREKELSKTVTYEPTLFYPFSGPDFLYANAFFSDAKKYVLIGLEPVGTLPELKTGKYDSLGNYFNQVNNSLNAILKFSFFRTNSMEQDLKNTEVDGVIHLILLFLNRSGNQIISAKAISLDSAGNKTYYPGFEELKQRKLSTSGLELIFLSPDKQQKELCYFSANISDAGLKKNKGLNSYLDRLNHMNTYLKGASYLLHKPYFSRIRNCILKNSSTVVQDDSGIALRYFEKQEKPWLFTLYGKYKQPISMFRNFYQPDLDSLYRVMGPKDVGFGVGYNFKDKNSNLMVATHP